MNDSFIRLHSLAAENPPLFDHSLWVQDSIFEKHQTTTRFSSSSGVIVVGCFVFISFGDIFKVSEPEISCVRYIGSF